jgi:hypothetical protein
VADDDDAADKTFAAPPKKVRAGGCSEFGEVGLAICREQELATERKIARLRALRLAQKADV